MRPRPSQFPKRPARQGLPFSPKTFPKCARANAVWLIDQSIETSLDDLYIPTGASSLPPTHIITYGPTGELRIKGRPVIPVEYCSALGTVGDIILADLSEYRWI